MRFMFGKVSLKKTQTYNFTFFKRIVIFEYEKTNDIR